jgi:hypothetical protein
VPTKKQKNKNVAEEKSATKKITNKSVINIDLSENRETIQRKLTTLAHSRKKEALDKISDFITKTKDKDLRGFAQCAYDEAEFRYYSPENDEQEKKLLIAKLLKYHNDKLWKLMSRADSAKYELRELEIERGIDQKIFKAAHKTLKGWGYEEPGRFSEDYCTIVKHKLAEIEVDIEYESAWLREAEKMIKTEKFKNLPSDFFEHMHFNGEGGTFWTDEMGTDWEEDNFPEIRHDPLCDCGEEGMAEQEIEEAPF